MRRKPLQNSVEATRKEIMEEFGTDNPDLIEKILDADEEGRKPVKKDRPGPS
ncbi:MAG: hypothetical protein H0Z33_07670 [Bacillaceae bacterium]|nr:hypothetical protein [Bacillaceae bacterium]